MFNKIKKQVAKQVEVWARRDPKYRRQSVFRLMNVKQALAKLQKRGFVIGSIIDVGASNGCWSKSVSELWPDAKVHFVEANSVHESDLNSLCLTSDRYSYVLAAAGDVDGKIFFDASDSQGGLASHEPGEGKICVPVTTLTTQAEERNLPGPYLVKLDTHGFEVPILEGAADIFPMTDCFVIEVYNFRLFDAALPFWEMCLYMEERGFRVIDITEPAWRPSDEALWQADFVFLKEDAVQFSSNAYTK